MILDHKVLMVEDHMVQDQMVQDHKSRPKSKKQAPFTVL